MKRLMFVLMPSIAFLALAVQAVTHNDLAPYAAQGESDEGFWDPSGHAAVEVSVGEAACTGSGVIDTRTFYRAHSNVLPAFRTIPPTGFLLIVR